VIRLIWRMLAASSPEKNRALEKAPYAGREQAPALSWTTRLIVFAVATSAIGGGGLPRWQKSRSSIMPRPPKTRVVIREFWRILDQ
jgi:hypothetical protein